MLSKALFLPNIIESKKSRIQSEIAKTQETQRQRAVLSAPLPSSVSARSPAFRESDIWLSECQHPHFKAKWSRRQMLVI